MASLEQMTWSALRVILSMEKVPSPTPLGEEHGRFHDH